MPIRNLLKSKRESASASRREDFLGRLAPESLIELPNLREWVGNQGRPLTVFDLETTAKIARYARIIEVGLVTVLPDGRVLSGEEFVDPESKIPKAVIELTGIAPNDVAGHATWGDYWAKQFVTIAQEHWTAGFNSWRYDRTVVIRLNAKYNAEVPEFTKDRHIDVYYLPKVGRAKLGESAEKNGVKFVGAAHRALSDARATAKLLDLVVGELSADQLIQKGWATGGDKTGGKRAARRREIEERLNCGERPSVRQLAQEYELAPSTIEGDLSALVRDDRVPAAWLMRDSDLDLVRKHVMASVGAIRARNAPVGLSEIKSEIEARSGCEIGYFELRLGVFDQGFRFDRETKEYERR